MKLKILVRYLVSLYEELITLISGSIISVSAWLVSGYLPQFPFKTLSIITIVLSFIVANYRAYSKLRNKLDELVEKSARFSVTALLYSYDFNDMKSQAKAELATAENEIAQIKQYKEAYLQNYLPIFQRTPSAEQWEAYTASLRKYLDEIEELKKRLETEEAHVSFLIRNESNASDQDINLSLEALDDSTFEQLIPPLLPSMPDRPRTHTLFKGSSAQLLSAPNNRSRSSFNRTVLDQSDTSISVEFSKLLAKADAALTYSGFIIHQSKDFAEMKMIISSDRTSKPITLLIKIGLRPNTLNEQTELLYRQALPE